jgi:acyl dehydratase
MTAPRPTRPDGLWADDLHAGQTFTSGSYELTEQAITDFARQFDPQPFHLDPRAARGTFFDGLVASGWHTAAITMRLLVTSGLPLATGIVGSGGEVNWPSAAVPGDVLHVEVRIDEIVPSRSRPERVAVLISHRTVNQDGEVRQRSKARLICWKRVR